METEGKLFAMTEAHIFLFPTWHSKTEFFNPNATDFWARLFFVVWGLPMHYRMFSNIFGLYPLDVSNTASSHPTPKL